MRPLAAQAGLGHTTASGRSGGRGVLVIHPRDHHCVRRVNAHTSLSCGVTRFGLSDLFSAPYEAYIDYEAGKLKDYDYPEQEVASALVALPGVA